MGTFTKDHRIAISGVLIGAIIAVLVPIWQIYWVETPNLNIEVISIERSIDDSEVITIPPELIKLIAEIDSLNRQPESTLFARIGGSIDSNEDYHEYIKKNRFSIKRLSGFIERIQSQLESIPKQITSLENSLEELKDTDAVRLSERKIRDISLEYYFREFDDEQAQHLKEYSKEEKNTEYFEDLKNRIKAYIQLRLTNIRSSQQSLSSKFKKMQDESKVFINELKNNNSKYLITTSITNSGNASVSVKRPALFRVYIGSGNYVDLKLEIPSEAYKDVAQIDERASKLITFFSKKLSELQSEDRKLVNQYWGKNVTGVIFIIDSLSNVESSGQTPFSDALYQKQIYDKLIFEASKRG